MVKRVSFSPDNQTICIPSVGKGRSVSACRLQKKTRTATRKRQTIRIIAENTELKKTSHSLESHGGPVLDEHSLGRFGRVCTVNSKKSQELEPAAHEETKEDRTLNEKTIRDSNVSIYHVPGGGISLNPKGCAFCCGYPIITGPGCSCRGFKAAEGPFCPTLTKPQLRVGNADEDISNVAESLLSMRAFYTLAEPAVACG